MTLHGRPTIAMPASFAHVANKLINSVFINPPLPPSLPQPLINTLSEEIQLSGKRTDQLSVPIIFPPCEINRVCIYIYIYTHDYPTNFHSLLSLSIPFVNFVDNRGQLHNNIPGEFHVYIKDCRRSSSLDRRKQVYLEARVP